jgi:hypothetical protein
MICSVNNSDCIPGRLRRGMCERHYRRWKRTGITDRRATIDNMSQYTVLDNGCWEWTGSLWPNGYGKTSVSVHGSQLAHRVFYTDHVGPIKDGFDIDHRCHNTDLECVRGPGCRHRRCVNPAHLEPVSRQTNLLRAITTRTVCEAGLHDLTILGATRSGTSQCTACWRIRYRAAGQRYRDKLRHAAS